MGWDLRLSVIFPDKRSAAKVFLPQKHAYAKSEAYEPPRRFHRAEGGSSEGIMGQSQVLGGGGMGADHHMGRGCFNLQQRAA